MTADQFDTVKNAVNLITFPSLNVEVATFNLNSTSKASKVFADKQVRQALWWALDRPAIIKAAFFGAGGAVHELTGAARHVGAPRNDGNSELLVQPGEGELDARRGRLDEETRPASVRRTASRWRGRSDRCLLQTAIEAMAEQWKAIGANVKTQRRRSA